jgi:hypothetical protein
MVDIFIYIGLQVSLIVDGRAMAQGVKLGRPKIDIATEQKVRKQLAKDVGILKVAKSLGIGTGTIHRISSLRGAEQ